MVNYTKFLFNLIFHHKKVTWKNQPIIYLVVPLLVVTCIFFLFQLSGRSTQKLVEIHNIVSCVGRFGIKYKYKFLGLANYGTCFIGAYLKKQKSKYLKIQIIYFSS